MRIPTAAKSHMKGCGETEQDTRQYVLDQIAFFGTLPNRTTTEAWWIAFKLGCTVAQAETVIKWAKESK